MDTTREARFEAHQARRAQGLCAHSTCPSKRTTLDVYSPYCPKHEAEHEAELNAAEAAEYSRLGI